MSGWLVWMLGKDGPFTVVVNAERMESSSDFIYFHNGGDLVACFATASIIGATKA